MRRIILPFLFLAYRIGNTSMLPTVSPGDLLLIKLKPQSINRGDVIIINPHGDQRSHQIKRVIGMPRDEILIDKGSIIVNNHLLSEPYLKGRPRTEFSDNAKKWSLGKNYYLVMGDNRLVSTDSRTLGPISRQQIIGKAIYRLWPLVRLRKICN